MPFSLVTMSVVGIESALIEVMLFVSISFIVKSDGITSTFASQLASCPPGIAELSSSEKKIIVT